MNFQVQKKMTGIHKFMAFLKYSLLLLSFLISSSCLSQSLDSLSSLIFSIQNGSSDSIRFAANAKFYTGFEKILHMNGSFTRNFDSLKNVSVLKSTDGTFRLYTWMVPHYSGDAYNYFGFIQIHSELSDTIFPLRDSTDAIKKPESEKLQDDRWLGAIYYSIIPVKKSKKNYYTLLGWKAKNEMTTQKIIEVLYFDRGRPKFGYSLLKTGSVFRNRMIFSFSSQASMTLRFDENYNGIVFDHISQDKNSSSNVTGPDGTYDTFKLKKGRWILYNDIDARTKWEPSEILPVPPEK